MVERSNKRDSAAVKKVVGRLQAVLPPRWKVKNRPLRKASDSFDAAVEIVSPDAVSGEIMIDLRKKLYPKDVAGITAVYPGDWTSFSVVVAAPFLSKRVREKLTELRLNFMDETGNTSMQIDRPGLMISMQGADENPRPVDRGRPTLKGATAGRIVRALADFKPPVGVRELATRAGGDPGYTSRVIRFLAEEDLIRRERRGKVLEVDWKDLIAAWSKDYSFLDSNTIQTYLAPRGLDDLKKKLRETKKPYAVTGSLAAVEIAPFAPARAAAIYTTNPDDLAKGLDLRPLEGGGANAVLALPLDPIVFERTEVRNGITCVAPSQLAVDLMTGPGRNPAEAEELMKWMEKNEDAWRS